MSDHLGTSVSVPGTVAASGILKYVGSINGKQGLFGGIELQGPSAKARGKNNGDVDGTLYFEVSEPKTGLFLPWERLVQANPQLLPIARTVSRSRRESTRTPTPTRINYEKPEKRASRVVSEGSRPSSMRRPESRSDNRKSISRQVSMDGNKRDTEDWKARYEHKCRELEQKQAILVELQATVDKLQPILEDYELSMDEKDRKIKKQRQEYEKAREEWRQSLELMISSQQEAENLYEMQVSDLKEELRRSGGADSGESEEKLQKKVAMLTQDVSSMETVVHDMQAQLRAKDVQIEELEAKLEEQKSEKGSSETSRDAELDELSAQMSSMSVNEWKQKEERMNKRIDDMEQHAQKQALEVQRLEKQLEAEKRSESLQMLESTQEMTSNDGSHLNDDLLRKIDTLEHELHMRPSFDELTELQASLEDIEALHMREVQEHQLELQRTRQQNAELHQRLAKMGNQVGLESKKEEESKAKKEDEKSIKKEEVSHPHTDLDLREEPRELPIYMPPTKTDPSGGRPKWCGLCERDGHDSLHCPYENDIF